MWARRLSLARTGRKYSRAMAPRRWQQTDSPGSGLQEIVRPDHRAPHVRHGRVVESQSFLRLAEVAADDVREDGGIYLHPFLEGIDVEDGDQPRGHVPAVIARIPVRLLDVLGWLVIRAEELVVGIRV